MKKFNELEKRYLKELRENFENAIHNHLILIEYFKETVLNNRVIKFDDANKYIYYHFPIDKSDKYCVNELATFISLIDYLLEKGLISKIEEPTLSESKYISYNIINGEYPFRTNQNHIDTKSLVFLSPYYYEKIRSFEKSTIWVSFELIDLIDNNFQTIEVKTYIEAKKQTKLSVTVFFSFSWNFYFIAFCTS